MYFYGGCINQVDVFILINSILDNLPMHSLLSMNVSDKTIIEAKKNSRDFFLEEFYFQD